MSLFDSEANTVAPVPNKTKDRIVLWGSFVCMYFYIVITHLRPNIISSLMYGLGAMIVEGAIMYILYFLARKITKQTGNWHPVYLGLLLAYLIISPMLQRYGSGGRFFG